MQLAACMLAASFWFLQLSSSLVAEPASGSAWNPPVMYLFVPFYAGGLSSLLMPSIFGKPLGRSGSSSPVVQDSKPMIPVMSHRPEIQAASMTPSSLGQLKLGRYRSGTSPLGSAAAPRPMQWGFGTLSPSPVASAADRPKQTFELPMLNKGVVGSFGVNRGQLGSGRFQQQIPQQPSSTLASQRSRHLFSRQY